MIIADFACSKCKAVFDLDGVEAGQLVDCPQCGAAFEVPRGKTRAPQKVVIVSTVHPPMHPGKKAVNIGTVLLILAVCVLCVPDFGGVLAVLFGLVGLVFVVVGRMREP